jgi:hypothetical protein
MKQAAKSTAAATPSSHKKKGGTEMSGRPFFSFNLAAPATRQQQHHQAMQIPKNDSEHKHDHEQLEVLAKRIATQFAITVAHANAVIVLANLGVRDREARQ